MLRQLLIFVLFSSPAFSQTVKVLSSGTKSNIRGLSVVNDHVLWASGNNGIVGLSLNGGSTWNWSVIKGFEKTDFRDIKAFDAVTAVVMAIAEPAYILKTIDGGQSWKVVYENKLKGMFLDAMEFWNDQSGIVIGDPINNKFFILRTFDGGNTWRDLPKQNYPIADSGEACFASSGTNIRKVAKDEACFVSGGLRSRFYVRDQKYDLPLIQGKESTGANSLAVKNKRMFIVVGGDFSTPDATIANCATTHDGGKTWELSGLLPHGYRSCVEYLGKKNWICCGLNGVDYSKDDGKTWTWISKESFNTCRKAKDGKSVFLAGSTGKIAVLVLP